MAEYRYYLIPDFMSHVFPQQFEEQAPTEFFSNTADLMKRYQQLREMPYNNEYTWNERTNLPYPRLTVGIDRRDPDGAVTIMQVRNGVNYLCDDYRGPFRFLYNGIIIKHQKTEPTYTKTSLFLCEKRRFFMARREKGVVPIIYFEKERGKSF